MQNTGPLAGGTPPFSTHLSHLCTFPRSGHLPSRAAAPVLAPLMFSSDPLCGFGRRPRYRSSRAPWGSLRSGTSTYHIVSVLCVQPIQSVYMGSIKPRKAISYTHANALAKEEEDLEHTAIISGTNPIHASESRAQDANDLVIFSSLHHTEGGLPFCAKQKIELHL